MIILAIETSCDDTSIAIFENNKLITLNTSNQSKIHNKTCWVVPEVAARTHASNIFKVLKKTLKESKLTLEDINYVWVTTKPWLIGSLLTWTTVASTVSTILKKEIIPICHIEAHIFSNFIERQEKDIKFPLVCLTVSWWHNDIYFMKDMWNIKKLWTSQDDAGWEAFDKVAKMMDLWYPWWPIISKLSYEYEKKRKNEKKIFPRVWLVKNEFNFSFSWLKSAVRREIEKRIEKKWKLDYSDKQEIAFEFECSVVEVLNYKIINAAKQKWVKTILLAWWVSANNRLIDSVSENAKKEWFNFIFPTKKIYCWDNAAMIWIYAYYKIKYKKFEKKIGVVKI